MPQRHHSRRKLMLFTTIQIAHPAVKRTHRAQVHAAHRAGTIATLSRGHTMSRFRIACLATAAALSLVTGTVNAADKVTFLTSWYAQAEHGGFYQAKAAGIYEKAGLDVTIKMGGPQVNGSQLLLAGETDFMMGYDIQVLKGREQNLPLVTVASSFQFDLQGLMTHDDVASLAALKGKPILIAGSSRVTFWP